MREIRLAARALRRAPLFAVLATLSLAVGIAANVTVFSIVDGLLLRPLPVSHPEQLVRLGRSTRDAYFGTVSYPEYLDLRSALASALDLIGHYPNTATLTLGNEPRTIWLELVSANYFPTLGVRLPLGRGFTPNEVATAGEAPVIVLSDRLWHARFGGDPTVLGKTAKVNGHPFTIIGVAPPSFHGTFTGFDIDAWVPATMQAVAVPRAGSLDRRDDRFLMLIGRLRQGVSVDRARAALSVAAPRLRTTQQDTSSVVRLDIADATGVHPAAARIVTAFLGLLQGVVLLVLLVACANLANLLLVRVSSRERELSIRRALGATRARIASVLLAESVLIAAGGGLLGCGLALAADFAIPRAPLDVGVPLALGLGIDGRVLAFTLGATVLTTLAFGVGPALAASRLSSLCILRAGSATATRRSGRVRATLVGAQVALSAVLLFGSGLMLRSLYRSRTLEPGFDPSHIELFAASPDQLGYDETRGRALWQNTLERAGQISDVRSAALALLVPLGNRGDVLASGPLPATRPTELLPYNYVSANYFATLRIPLVAGRDFNRHDDRAAADVAIVSTTMARQFFGEGSPLGRQIRVVAGAGRERRATVIGVVGDVKIRTLGEPPRPMLYLPFGQWYGPDMVLHVRSENGANVARNVVSMMHALEPNLAVDVQTMSHATAFSLIPLQVAGAVLGFAGAVGLALATLGVFGLVAYAVSLRTREIGIRMALGAERWALARFVSGQGVRPVLVGLLVGLPIAVAGGTLLRRILVGVAPADPVTLLFIVIALLASAGAAFLIPLRRALRTDAARVLREE
jgi:predicted permease